MQYFDADLYQCWMFPKRTAEGQFIAEAYRAKKRAKVPYKKIHVPRITEGEIKKRVKQKATNG